MAMSDICPCTPDCPKRSIYCKLDCKRIKVYEEIKRRKYKTRHELHHAAQAVSELEIRRYDHIRRTCYR